VATRATSFGAAHGSEIAYAFNSVKNARTPPDAEGVAIAQSMNRYWAAFAKTGDPGSAGGPAWPRFDAAQEAVMEFGAGGKPVVQPHFHKARLDWVEQNIGWYSPMVIVR
jgi:para-nitrobenzyl esterase